VPFVAGTNVLYCHAGGRVKIKNSRPFVGLTGVGLQPRLSLLADVNSVLFIATTPITPGQTLGRATVPYSRSAVLRALITLEGGPSFIPHKNSIPVIVKAGIFCRRPRRGTGIRDPRPLFSRQLLESSVGIA
jgi:hypothetical protein